RTWWCWIQRCATTTTSSPRSSTSSTIGSASITPPSRSRARLTPTSGKCTDVDRRTLDRVLKLRPGNAVSRLKSSRFPVLNPTDLVSALGGKAPLLLVTTTEPPIIAAWMRASRHLDAPIGIGAGGPLDGRDSAARFFESVRREAELTWHEKPVF